MRFYYTYVYFSAGSDYEQVTLPLLFRPGDEKQCFNIPVLPDELDEGKEDVEARITFVPDGVVVSQPEVATISILDINGEKLATQCKNLHQDYLLYVIFLAVINTISYAHNYECIVNLIWQSFLMTKDYLFHSSSS